MLRNFFLSLINIIIIPGKDTGKQGKIQAVSLSIIFLVTGLLFGQNAVIPGKFNFS